MKKKRRKRLKPQAKSRKKMVLAIFGLILMGGIYLGARQSSTSSSFSGSSRKDTTPVASKTIPPFYENEEAAMPLPVTLPPAYFRNSSVAHAYRVAQQIPGVLAQQPCYCYCDKFGHGSLLDCYKSDHGAG